jgi:hypothetical protein
MWLVCLDKIDCNHSLGQLDAICIVMKSSDTRRSLKSAFEFDQIASLFGNNMRSNIFAFVTFSDDSNAQPTIIDADIPFVNYYRFNNGSVYEHPSTISSIQSQLFDMSNNSFRLVNNVNILISNYREFFDDLGRTSSQSIAMSRDVIANRRQLEQCVDGLRHKVDDEMRRLDTLNDEFQIMQQHEADIRSNRQFNYEIIEDQINQQQNDDNRLSLVCLDCR